jgi:hypothetical protein
MLEHMTAARDFNFRIVHPRPSDRGTSHNVSADLEDIFRGAPQPAPDVAVTPRVHRVRPRARDARTHSIAGLGLAAAAGLAGLAIGLVAMRHPSTVTPPPPRPSASLTVAQVQPPPRASELASPAALAARPASAPNTVRTTTGPAIRRVAAREPALGRCARVSRGAALARCAYPAVMVADRRLRTAYGHAVRAGVPRPLLVSYRNRWASLRRDANDHPARTVAVYGAMADDLQRLARRRGS